MPILEQVANAIDYAHRNGFIHGDIKPQNLVMVKTKDSFCIKLIDFGTVEKIKLKYAEINKTIPHAFITFTTKEAADRVFGQLNGTLFMGRAMR